MTKVRHNKFEKAFPNCILLLILFSSIYSCASDDATSDDSMIQEQTCIEDTDLGQFQLLETSKPFLPYSEEELTLIFSDSVGTEYKGYYSAAPFGRCDISSSYMLDGVLFPGCSIVYNTECREARIWFPGLGENFEVQFIMEVDVTVDASDNEILFSDQLGINVFPEGEEDDTEFEIFTAISFYTHQLPIIIYQRNNNRNTATQLFRGPERLEELTIHGNSYANVYSQNDSFVLDQDDYKIYYSPDIGLVAIDNKHKSILLKFERVE